MQRAAASSALSPGQLCTTTRSAQKFRRNPGRRIRWPSSIVRASSYFRLEDQNQTLETSVKVDGFKVLKILSRGSMIEQLPTVQEVHPPTLLSPKQTNKNPKINSGCVTFRDPPPPRNRIPEEVTGVDEVQNKTLQG